MSASPSPKPSFESEDRPESSAGMSQDAGTNQPSHVSFGDNPRNYSPRRRSIQFNVGATQSQLPTRSLSFKDKRRSYGDAPIREAEVEREPRPLSTTRGPSPPPPK